MEIKHHKFNTGLNLSRVLLPQIPQALISKFIETLGQDGIDVSVGDIPVNKLTPSQGDFNLNKIKKMTDSDQKIIVSKDNYVLDGHHRWAAKKRKAGSPDISCIQVDLNILDLVKYARDFCKVELYEGKSSKVILRSITENRKILNI